MSTADVPLETDEALPDEAPAEGPRLLRSITPRNLLSFGPQTPPLELRSLNVLIGANGSGKSNLIDAVALLRSMAGEPWRVISDGGGIREWIWKGDPGAEASVEALAETSAGNDVTRHLVMFTEEAGAFALTEELIADGQSKDDTHTPFVRYEHRSGVGSILFQEDERKPLAPQTLRRNKSILTQRRDPDAYPRLHALATGYEQVRIYREWAFGRNTVFRVPQRADLPNDRLAEDFSNLGLVLNRLRRNPKAKADILKRLRDLYEGLADYDVSVQAGTVQVFFTEGDYTIPATRLSDGSLRYLCLLAILCDPEPPPLICIEEPELGLHPDLVVKLADLLVEASERTQLIVTTHSEMLVDCLTESPEAVVVCDKDQGRTTMERLSAEKLKPWLAKYGLAELWSRGQLGGTRW